MTEITVNDKDFLAISAMLRARESKMLDRDRMDRMLAAPSYQEAAKLLTDCGYEDMSGMDAKGVDEVLSGHRKKIFDEVGRMLPSTEIVDAFRLKYDYHNAKVIIKAEGAGISGEHLLSEAGRVSSAALKDAYEKEDFRFVPDDLGKAMVEAKSTLARTANPQLADFVLDRANFAEMTKLARAAGSAFLMDYTKVLIDAANLRSIVRTERMGRGQDFLMNALMPGGTTTPERMVQASVSGDGLPSVFTTSGFREAALLGTEAMRSGSVTKFELACDNAVTAFLSSAKLKPFGTEAVVEYLALIELEITAIRMILTGRLAKIEPDVIRERLRDINA